VLFRGRYRGSWRARDPHGAFELIHALGGGQGHTL
jgi:hypothetical protein